MTVVLRNKIEASERSAQHLEAELAQAHQNAMICRDIEDLARELIELLAKANHQVERWQNEIARSTPQNRPQLLAQSTEWDERYRKLGAIFEREAKLIRDIERAGFGVEGKKDFRQAWRAIRAITCFSMERVSAAVEGMNQREGRPLHEVKDELWNHP